MEILLAGLKPKRQAAGLTQQQLADLAGVSVSLVQKHEQGVIHGVDSPTIEALTAALNCTRRELFFPSISDISEIGSPKEAI